MFSNTRRVVTEDAWELASTIASAERTTLPGAGEVFASPEVMENAMRLIPVSKLAEVGQFARANQKKAKMRIPNYCTITVQNGVVLSVSR